MNQWYIQAHTNDIVRTMEETNRMGAIGWEVVGITTADRTIGMNTNVLILKRPIDSVPPPPSTDDEWQQDPTGRFDKRRWDAEVQLWTAQTAMMEAKTTHIDPPRAGSAP